jgi:hypothetical protein
VRENPEKRKHWQRHIDTLKTSGQTRKKYCEANQLNLSTLDYWCRKLSPRREKKTKKKAACWVPLQIREDGSTSEIDLRIGRITIAVKSGFDPALLKELLHAIGAQC